jgi:integrase
MAGRQKRPTLRDKDGCLVTDIYKPGGRRTTVSFGGIGERSMGAIYTAFGQWLDLFEQHPHKVLTFSSPYDALASIINPRGIVSLGQLYDKYIAWLGGQLAPMRSGKESPDLTRTRRLGAFILPYRDWPVGDFGPEELIAVQQSLVEHRYFRGKRGDKPLPYTRSAINQLINIIHKIWRWGVGREVTTEAQVRRLSEVRPLRVGKTLAPDRLKRAMVTEEEFEKVVAKINPVVADMLRIMWHTAMRPNEVCRMRPLDILRDDANCWLYVPGRDVSLVGDHKTAHHQRVRAIPLTSQCQTILKRWIESFDSDKRIFQPAAAVRAICKEKYVGRNAHLARGHQAGANLENHPMIKPGEMYTIDSFRTAVTRACKRAGVERFTLYDIRRSAATRVRSELGKEAAKLLLGHVSTDTTDIYLLDEVKEAMKVAKQLDTPQD